MSFKGMTLYAEDRATYLRLYARLTEEPVHEEEAP